MQIADVLRAVLVRSGHRVVLSFPMSSEDGQAGVTHTEKSPRLEESQARLFFTPPSIFKVI